MNISPHDFLQLVASFPPGRLVELRYELACQVSMIITRWRPGTFDTVSHWVFDAFRQSAQTPGELPFKVVDFAREKDQVIFLTSLDRMVPI